jgi:hypothetical protein
MLQVPLDRHRWLESAKTLGGNETGKSEKSVERSLDAAD